MRRMVGTHRETLNITDTPVVLASGSVSLEWVRLRVCRRCEMLERDHPEGKCLFDSQSYDETTLDNSRIVDAWATVIGGITTITFIW